MKTYNENIFLTIISLKQKQQNTHGYAIYVNYFFVIPVSRKF